MKERNKKNRRKEGRTDFKTLKLKLKLEPWLIEKKEYHKEIRFNPLTLHYICFDAFLPVLFADFLTVPCY